MIINEDFTKLYNRWKGGDVRKEDKFEPEYVDFGDSKLYWTKYNLVLDGNDRFSWEEIHDFNKNGWRLPSLIEIRNTNFNKCTIENNSKSLDIVMPNGDSITIRNRILGGFYLWSSNKHERLESFAYVYGFTREDEFNTKFVAKPHKYHVFLVKEKKDLK